MTLNLFIGSSIKAYKFQNNQFSLVSDLVDNCMLENEWIMARNLSTKISDVARSQYESRIIMICNNNPKTFWSYVKKKHNKPGDVSTLEDNHGQLITSDITKAKLLNNYF